MKAIAVFPKTKRIELINHPEPAILKEDEVLFEVLQVGICGTDREIAQFLYGETPNGDDYIILGHECLGRVIETGKSVSKFKEGDYLVPVVRRPCEHNGCQACKHGYQDFCSSHDFKERGIKGAHGFMTEMIVEQEKFLVKIPSYLKDVAVLTEPLSVAQKALREYFQINNRFPWIKSNELESKSIEGKNALVLGAGPVGILGAMLFKSKGFETFVYSRGKEDTPKAELVKSIGVKYISSSDKSAKDLPDIIGNIDLVYEAVGDPKISFNVLKNIGVNSTFIFTGIPLPAKPLDLKADELMKNIVLKNQLIVGTVNADMSDFEESIKSIEFFMKEWPEQLKSIITSRIKLEDAITHVEEKNGIKEIVEPV